MTNLYRPRPIDIEAIQWTGTNADQMRAFAGAAFDEIPPEDRTEDADATAQISDFSEWRLLCPGDWVIRRGEDFEAMGREEFAETYEPAEEADRG